MGTEELNLLSWAREVSRGVRRGRSVESGLGWTGRLSRGVYPLIPIYEQCMCVYVRSCFYDSGLFRNFTYGLLQS